MVVGCVNCTTKFVVPDDKVPETGIKVRCSKCQHTFYIKKEKPKRGGPSSVVMIAPDLIDEIQKAKEEGPAAGVQIADDLAPTAEPAAPAATAATATGPTPEEAKAGSEQRRVNTRVMQAAPAPEEAPNANHTQKLSAHSVPKAPRASSPVNAPKEEEVLELSEVYLPPDWGKRIMIAFLCLLGLTAVTGVAAIIRNNFQVPAARDFFTVLLNGPKKKTPLIDIPNNTPSFEAQKNSVEKLVTNSGTKLVAIQGEVKNTSREPHGKFYVKATLQNAGGETLESERPCGTRLDSPWLIGITSEGDLDKLYTEDGTDGANRSVPPFGSVPCTVVFFNAPAWAENPTGVKFVITRADGGLVAP
jgi:predicted Zn finger-like uncharacterized protein